MKEKLKFLWIDDEPQKRKGAAESMGNELDVSIKFISVEDQDIDESLQKILKDNDQPDLVIMDHYLNKTTSTTFKRGSTAASIIHEKWPECPIVSVTAVDIRNDVDTRQRSAYENMFPDHHISNHYQTIYSIAEGFKVLKTKRPKSREALFDCLRCPGEDRERLQKILPFEIKEDNSYKDHSFLIEVYRWFNSVMLKRPGFLYDKIWSATYLGLSEKGFDSVVDLFEPAKFLGVFTDPSNPRWWKSQLTLILAQKTGKVGLPWIVGRDLVPPTKNNFSFSQPTKREYPETVAAKDESHDTEWVPMRLDETEPHPHFEDMLFFEQLRIMK